MNVKRKIEQWNSSQEQQKSKTNNNSEIVWTVKNISLALDSLVGTKERMTYRNGNQINKKSVLTRHCFRYLHDLTRKYYKIPAKWTVFNSIGKMSTLNLCDLILPTHGTMSH